MRKLRNLPLYVPSGDSEKRFRCPECDEVPVVVWLSLKYAYFVHDHDDICVLYRLDDDGETYLDVN